jgi:hypothetical protein
MIPRRTARRSRFALSLAGTWLALAPVAAGAAKPAIVGGSQITIGQAPWQVAVEAMIPEEKDFVKILCGGSILDAAHIVTAAHCVFDPKTGEVTPAEDFTVRTGTSNLASHGEPEEQERVVTNVRAHPYYTYTPDSGQVLPDDIAVLTLQEPLLLGPAAAAIPMVSPGASPAEGTLVTLTGFGEENPLIDELNDKLYSLGMTVGWPRECGGENDAVLLCASSPSGTPCNGDSGGGLTLGSPATLVGVEDDFTLVSGKRCVAGAENAFADVAAPEIQDFLDGSEEPPRAPRGGHAVIREAPINGGVMSCESGSWSESPTFTYTFLDSSTGQIVQQGASTTYAVPAAELGHGILCEVQASNAGGTGVGRTPPLQAISAAPVPQLASQLPAAQATAATAPPTPPPTGHVSLAGTSIAVQNGGAALVKLECVGSASCRGKLTLTAKSTVNARGKKQTTRRTMRIGTVSFSIPGNEVSTVKITLDAAGHAALSADHGRLSAGLALIELAPGSEGAQAKAVLLVREKVGGRSSKSRK